MINCQFCVNMSYEHEHDKMNVTSQKTTRREAERLFRLWLHLLSMRREYNDGGKIPSKCLITEEISFIDNLYSCLARWYL